MTAYRGVTYNFIKYNQPWNVSILLTIQNENLSFLRIEIILLYHLFQVVWRLR